MSTCSSYHTALYATSVFLNTMGGCHLTALRFKDPHIPPAHGSDASVVAGACITRQTAEKLST